MGAVEFFFFNNHNILLSVLFCILRRGLNIISCSFRQGQEQFSFQTKWMAHWLLERSEEGNKPYSGGSLSNVTNRFFVTR
jgi:hypothetical protein